MAATAELASLLNLQFISNILANDWANWDPTMASGNALSWDGLISVSWEYVGVVVVLAKLYVALAIYKFFYGIISSFVNFIKNPYLPFKSK
jgi:hypothetical protein